MSKIGSNQRRIKESDIIAHHSRHYAGYIWWSYAKQLAHVAGNPKALKRAELLPGEIAAYDAAVAETLALPDGERRMKLVQMVIIDRLYTVYGASCKLYISEATGKRWHADFIRRVGRGLGFHVNEIETLARQN